MKVRIPDHVDMTNVLDLTKGKTYEAEEVEYGGVNITDDVGDHRYVLIDRDDKLCATLKKQAAWEVVETEQEPETT